MHAKLIPASGGLWHVFFGDEPVAMNVNHEEGTELLDFYERVERAIDAAAFGLIVPADEMAMLSPRCRGVHLN